MRILDRYILKNFLINYLLALCVLVGVFVLFDLIVNIQDFAKGATPGGETVKTSAWAVASDILDYYMFQLPMIYQVVSGIIPTLAAGFTMVRMTRHHELTAMMASGVSLYRVAAPIILCTMGFAALHVINQEFVISQPLMIEKLLRKHDEVNTVNTKGELVMFVKDADGSLLSATDYQNGRQVPVSVTGNQDFTRKGGSFVEEGLLPGYVITTSGFSNAANNGAFKITAVTATQLTVQKLDATLKILQDHPLVAEGMGPGRLSTGATMRNVFIVWRQNGMPIKHKHAESAHWQLCMTHDGLVEPAWGLYQVEAIDDMGVTQDAGRSASDVQTTSDLSPEQIELILSRKAVDYLSSARVHELARASPEANRPLLLKIMHLRFTQPLMNIIMLLIGIPFLLTREPSKLVVNMFMCTAISGTIFVATFVLFQLGGTQINPLWSAWLPVIIFGPFAAVMLSEVRT